MTKHLLLLAYLGACVTELDQSPISNGYDPNVDPWQDVERIEREGPPRYTSRVHSCAKIRYATLGNVLASRGVNLATTDYTSSSWQLIDKIRVSTVVAGHSWTVVSPDAEKSTLRIVPR